MARSQRGGWRVPSAAAGQLGHTTPWVVVPQASPSSSLQAFVDLLTGGMAAATAMAWRQVSPLAACLLYLYLAWLAFSAMLNYRMWQDNQGRRSGRSLGGGRRPLRTAAAVGQALPCGGPWAPTATRPLSALSPGGYQHAEVLL